MIYHYGEQMLKQGDIDSLDDWDLDKEMAFRIMDSQFDYLWEMKDGKIIFTDRLWSFGEIDDMGRIREKEGTLKLEFLSFEDVFRWIINHTVGHEDDWYDWIVARLNMEE